MAHIHPSGVGWVISLEETAEILGISEEEIEEAKPRLWVMAGEGANCPQCFHEPQEHKGSEDGGCGIVIDYDHMNGDHGCGCPLQEVKS